MQIVVLWILSAACSIYKLLINSLYTHCRSCRWIMIATVGWIECRHRSQPPPSSTTGEQPFFFKYFFFWPPLNGRLDLHLHVWNMDPPSSSVGLTFLLHGFFFSRLNFCVKLLPAEFFFSFHAQSVSNCWVGLSRLDFKGTKKCLAFTSYSLQYTNCVDRPVIYFSIRIRIYPLGL